MAMLITVMAIPIMATATATRIMVTAFLVLAGIIPIMDLDSDLGTDILIMDTGIAMDIITITTLTIQAEEVPPIPIA